MAEIKVGDRVIHTNSCQKISGKVIRIVAEVEVDGLRQGMNVVPYETFNLTHEPGSVVALIEKDGLVLSVTRRKKPENVPIEGNYSLVGGSVEPTDKSPYAALVREVDEEVKTVEGMGHRGYTSAKTFKEAAVSRLKALIPEPAEPAPPEGRPEGCDCWGSSTCSLCDPGGTGRRTVGAPATVDDLRALGWTVAVHNDYRLQGQAHTFWLFTKGDFAAKGEGRTDSEALSKAMSEARRIEARWA